MRIVPLALFVTCLAVLAWNDSRVSADPVSEEEVERLLEFLESERIQQKQTESERGIVKLDTDSWKCHYKKAAKDEEEKIVGGENAIRPFTDWYIQIKFMNGTDKCGGILIHPRLILTAAHCFFTPESHNKAIGDKSCSSVKTGNYYVRYRTVERKITHYYYKSVFRMYGQHMRFDVAVAILDEQIHLSYTSPPLCIRNDVVEPDHDDECLAIGNGDISYGDEASSHLQMKEVSVHKCSPNVRELLCTSEGPTRLDSGSVVVCKPRSDPSKYYLAGIISERGNGESKICFLTNMMVKHENGRWLKKLIVNLNGC